MTPPRCDNCRFWGGPRVRANPRKYGLGPCLRRSPKAPRSDYVGIASMGLPDCKWPITREDYWCGEYEPTSEEVL